MLEANLTLAVEEIIKHKKSDPQIRARIETCVNLNSVKVYIIKKEKIISVITIDGAAVCSVEDKGEEESL